MAWYNASWLYRFKITSDQTKVDEAIDNVYYDLANAPAAFWTHVKADGGDIRVTTSDQVTEVAREVSGFSVGSTVGSLYLAATGLSASVDTDYYVYYGNSGASEPAAGATYGKNNVWTSYLCVFHFDEASGNVTCSKSGTTGTNTGVTLGATGKLRTGGSWDSTDYIACGNNFGITAPALSISAWVNPTSLAFQRRIVCKISGSDTDGYGLLLKTDSTMQLAIADASGAELPVSSAVITTAALQHIAATLSGTAVAFYRNGSPAGTVTMGARTPTNAGKEFTIGNFDSTFNSEPMLGVLDELRVSTTPRASTWWTTEYNNQNSPSTFWSTGAETQDVAAPLLWLPRQLMLRGPRGLMTPSGPVPPVTPEA